jgi:nucleotide-binding universal stress UspA family protein
MQIRSILCPVDFSEASRSALRAAARVSRQFTAQLHVLFVEDPLLAQVEHGASRWPDLSEELKEFLAGTISRDLPTEPRIHLAVGEPAREIVAVAGREGVELIVMGAHGLTGVRKAFFGSTTARVLKRSTGPVLVVPASSEEDKAINLEGLGSMLVLTDFGAAAAGAADLAAELAHSIGARPVLVHVLPRMSVPQSWRPRAEAAMKRNTAEAHQRMCDAMAPLERYGPVESVIVQGNVAECVADLARARRAGLIVMGLERGETGPRPGSTAYPVICSAPVPVLAVPVKG